MRVRKRLLLGSLGVSLVLSVAIGWVVSRSHDSGGSSGDVVVIDGTDGSTVTFRPPTLETNAVVEGKSLPVVTLQTLKGDDVTTAGLLGQPLVINVWGSTCTPCKAELPAFATVHGEYGDRVRFVGVDYLGPSDYEEQFARDRGVNYELLYDANGEFVSKVGIGTFPVTLFVTPDGTIVQQTGQLDADRLRSLIESDLL